MIVFRLIQFLLVIAIALFLVSQVVWPMLKGVRLFPLFSRRSRLEKELIELRDEKEVATLEREVESERKNVERVKNIRAVKEGDES
jgi:hypothetical protein